MKKIIIIIVSFLALALGWYLISPIFIDTVVNEPIPAQQVAVTPIIMTPEMVKSKNIDIPDDIIIGNDIVMDEPMMEMKSEMSSEIIGSFVGADNFHQAKGEVKIITDGEKTFLRFEDFSVTNGPDLFVTLNKGNSVTGEYIIIDELKGNKGSQNYDISNYNIDAYQSVSIYCKAFSVEFATAQI